MTKPKITYKQIAKEIERTEAGIKAMKRNNPRILELIKKGLFYERQTIEEINPKPKKKRY